MAKVSNNRQGPYLKKSNSKLFLDSKYEKFKKVTVYEVIYLIRV